MTAEVARVRPAVLGRKLGRAGADQRAPGLRRQLTDHNGNDLALVEPHQDHILGLPLEAVDRGPADQALAVPGDGTNAVVVDLVGHRVAEEGTQAVRGAVHQEAGPAEGRGSFADRRRRI